MLKNTTQIMLLSGAVLLSWNVQAASEDAQYRSALAEIKSGRYEKGLPVLKDLMIKNPKVVRYRYDYIAALGWSQRDDEVLLLSRSWTLDNTLPTYVLEAIGRSARIKGDYNRSLEAYKTVLNREPQRTFSQVGYSLAKLGLGQTDDAKKLLATLQNQAGFRQELERGFLDYYLSHPEMQDKAVEFITTLRRQHPENPSYVYQHITVLAWAGRWEDALTLAKPLPIETLPPHLLEALARCARELHQYSVALGYYEAAIRKDARRPDSRVGYVMVLLDSIQERRQIAARQNNDNSSQAAQDNKQQVNREMQQLMLAVDLLEPLDPLQQSRLDVKEAWLRLHDTLRQDDYKILKIARNIQEKHDSRHLAAATAEIDALNRQGAPNLAAMHPMFDKVRAALRWDVELNEVGQDVRNGQVHYDAQTGNARYQKSEDALKHADSIRDRLASSNFPERQEYLNRLDYDRMIVLNDLRRPQEVIQVYEDLEARNVRMPYYAYVSAASSYLSLHSTAKARDVFQKALEIKPKDATALLGLYYAYLDNGQYEEALYIANWEIPVIKRDARAISAMAYAYTDQLKEAEGRMEALVREFPSDYELHKNLATIYRYRDKPRQADEQYKWVEGALPNDHNVQVGRAQANMATHNFQEAEKALEKAEALAPREADVKRARRDWETQNLRQLTVTAGYDHSVPYGSVNGKHAKEPEVSWKLYSQPINYNWRIFNEGKLLSVSAPQTSTVVAGAVRNTESFKTNAYYSGVGAEYRNLDNRAELSVGGVRYVNDGTIGGISAKNKVNVQSEYEHNFNDNWSVNGAAEYNTLNVPIKASQRGIYGNRLALGVTWAANESRRARLGLDFSKFDDNNKRWTWFAGWTERIISRPTYKLTASLDVRVDRNSLSAADAFYYNPEQEVYAGVGIDQEWVIDRFYDRSWKHRLNLSAGRINQKGYGSKAAAGFNYEHIWSFNDRADLNVGVGRSRRYYDGQIDYRNVLNSALNWRF
ncbi:MAG: tetratricopeptide repeat protein [Pseudomonadota bacterium]